MITQTFELNLIPEQAPVVIHCDQYDKGTGRLIVKLYEGDVAYTPTGTAVIQGTKPDGKGFNYAATLSGNTVTADLTEQMSAVAGHVRCQIVVTESTGRTGTFVFILDVQRSALPADSDLSESEYQLIEQAIEDAQAAVTDSQGFAEDAEAWAVGERGGDPVGPTDPTYNNNSKYYCDQASQYAQGGLHYSGSVLFAYIPTTGMSVGDMYNIEDDFTTDSRFQEGAGIACAAGTNIAWNPNSKWDVLAATKIGDIDDLNDVSITTPVDNQVLTYDANSGEWINANAQSGATSLDNLTDVDITTPTNGQVLTYSNGDWVNANGGGGSSTLAGLSDVDITTPTDGQTLVYDANSSEWVNGNGGGGSSTLSGLTDVTITSATDGQALLYDANSGDWVNGTVSGGGGMNTNGSNAATTVGMTNTKVFTIGDRTNKSAAGEYALELGDGANATGYGAYGEGVKNYATAGGGYNSYTLNANTSAETLVGTRSLSTYPYQAYGWTSNISDPNAWEATVDNGLDSDITLTSGNVTVRLHQNGTDIETYYTNNANINVTLYYALASKQNLASGDFSHVEGTQNTASGKYSHAEGGGTTASSSCAHAEGRGTKASSDSTHAEGMSSTASGQGAHAEGYFTTASGQYSHAEGNHTTAKGANQHVSGKYNIVDNSNTYAVIVGNGTASNALSNAATLDWSGNLVTAGDVENGNGVSLDGINKVSTLAVDLTSWTTDTTSQSGTTLYKKQISLNHLYVDCPSVEVGAGTGYTLPTTAEQASYDLIQYVTVDDTVPCLYLYASAVPTTAFYITVTGVD